MNPLRFLVVALLAALMIADVCSSAMAAGGESITVPTLAQPPTMNGSIDDSWSKAAQVPVTFDFTFQREGEPTVAHVAQDASALDVAFVVTQKEAITSVQETNGAGVLNDDNVTVALWPQGANGFAYTFVANPQGARYQTSGENASYSPQWTAVAHRSPTGYVVTMRIPFGVMRGGGSTAWKVQFLRATIATSGTQVWEHVDGQPQARDVANAGKLDGIAAAGSVASARPKPRVQVYGLGIAAPQAFGGDTSRIGADVALPVTATSSLLTTFHPDYSNVEVDQQSIAPTAFARYLSEVRPFFTQAANNVNYNTSCSNCPVTLYTPAIPTFRSGYAYEGAQGHMTFTAFDALGIARSDSAQALNYVISNPHESVLAALQRVAVDSPGIHDDATTFSTGYRDRRTQFFAYLNSGEDRGSNVTDPSLANYVEYGGGYESQNAAAILTLQKVGQQFSPMDGFVSQTDIAGYSTFFRRTLNFSPGAALRDVAFSGGFGRFHDHHANLAQAGGNAQINFDFRNLMTVHLFTNPSGVEIFNGEFLPFNTNGFFVGYKTQTATPTSIFYQGGPYSHGHLTSWSYVTTLPLKRHVNVSLEADENRYAPSLAVEPSSTQWLERTSLDWQFNRYASVDLGVRRIIGRNLPNAFQSPDLPTANAPCGRPNGFSPFDCVNAGNATFAFHFLAARNEFYAVYGSPNSLATTPAVYFKWIRYIGAEKGT